MIPLEQVKGVVANAYKEGAYKKLKGRERIAIFIRQMPLEPGKTIRIGYNSYKLEKQSYLVFIDLLYEANFAHPVIYELHNAEDGTVRRIEEQWPIVDSAIEQSLTPFILPKDAQEGKK